MGTEKSCTNCKHKDLPISELPCNNCKRFSNWEPEDPPKVLTENALAVQVGGDHYKSMKIQVVEFCHANGIPYMEGNVIKYVCRWSKKNGLADLKKAKHYIELIIQMEEQKSE